MRKYTYIQFGITEDDLNFWILEKALLDNQSEIRICPEKVYSFINYTKSRLVFVFVLYNVREMHLFMRNQSKHSVN